MVKWNYRGCQGHLTSLHRTRKLTYSQIGFYSLAVFILNLLSVYSLSIAFYFWKLFLCFKIYQFVWFLQLFFSTNENYLECVRITLECVGHTHRLFAITQNSMEKFYLLFVEEPRVMLTFDLANKNISSLQHSIPTSNITWNVVLGKKQSSVTLVSQKKSRLRRGESWCIFMKDWDRNVFQNAKKMTPGSLNIWTLMYLQ